MVDHFPLFSIPCMQMWIAKHAVTFNPSSSSDIHPWYSIGHVCEFPRVPVHWPRPRWGGKFYGNIRAGQQVKWNFLSGSSCLGFDYRVQYMVYCIYIQDVCYRIMGKFGGSFNLTIWPLIAELKTTKLKFSGGRNVSAVVATPETPN